MKFLHLIWSNLKRKKLRTSLTLLSIVVAFILFGFLSAIQQALVGGVQMAGADRLIVRHKVSIIQLLPESYKARMDRIPGVDFAAHADLVRRDLPGPEKLLHAKPRGAGGISEDVSRSRSAAGPDPMPGCKRAPAPSWAARRRNGSIGKLATRFPSSQRIWAQQDGNRTWTFDIVGIFDGKNKNTDTTPLFFRYDYFDEARRDRQRTGRLVYHPHQGPGAGGGSGEAGGPGI